LLIFNTKFSVTDNTYHQDISIDDQPADRPRFATVNDEDTMSFIEENRNKNTIYKTNSDLKIFKEWLASVRETRPLESIPPPELDNLLARFFLGKFSEYILIDKINIKDLY
jgi:hypothetical protein